MDKKRLAKTVIQEALRPILLAFSIKKTPLSLIAYVSIH